MHYSDTCSIRCADGYYSESDPQNFVCEKQNEKTGKDAPTVGIWSPREDTLRCEPVYCDATDLPRGANTFDPLIEQLKDYKDIHALDLVQLGAAPDQRSKCSAHYKGVGDAKGGETPAADGSCLTQCLPSWYPSTGDIHRQLKFTCTAEGSLGKGTWSPSTDSLNCEPGKLDPNQTMFSIDNDAETFTHAKKFNDPIKSRWYGSGQQSGSTCQGFPGAKRAQGTCFDGWALAQHKGPTMRFFVTAKDQHGLPRNYQTLTTDRQDVVKARIYRVPLDRLDAANRHLQPKMIDEHDCDVEDCDKLPLRSYDDSTVLISTPGGRGVTWETPDGENQWPDVSEGADGLWQIEHTFTEHGVFYLELFLCEPDTAACSTHHGQYLHHQRPCQRVRSHHPGDPFL